WRKNRGLRKLQRQPHGPEADVGTNVQCHASPAAQGKRLGDLEMLVASDHLATVETCRLLPHHPLKVRIRVRQPNALNLLHRAYLCMCCFRLPLKSQMGVAAGWSLTDVKIDSMGMNFATTSPTLRVPFSAGWILRHFTSASMSAPHS